MKTRSPPIGGARQKRSTTQLYNFGRHQVKSSVSLLVILPQTVTELCTSVPVTPVLCTLVQYLIEFCSRLEAASDVVTSRFVRLAVPNKCVTFRDPHINRCPEIRPEAVRGAIFQSIYGSSKNSIYTHLK